jgi:hypothetical protein
MKPPIILSDEGDVALFESIEDFERYVESPDIASYRVFDAAGQVIRLATEHSTSAQSRSVNIVPVGRVTVSESQVNEIAQLETLVRDFLARATGKSYDRGALPELLRALQATIGFTR